MLPDALGHAIQFHSCISCYNKHMDKTKLARRIRYKTNVLLMISIISLAYMLFIIISSIRCMPPSNDYTCGTVIFLNVPLFSSPLIATMITNYGISRSISNDIQSYNNPIDRSIYLKYKIGKYMTYIPFILIIYELVLLTGYRAR